MGKVIIIMAVVFTVIFATVTLTIKSRSNVIPDLLNERMASDNASNLGAYALKYAISRLKKIDNSPKGSDPGDIIDQSTVIAYEGTFEVFSNGFIDNIVWDFVKSDDYSYPDGDTTKEPQQNGNNWGKNRYRWRGGSHALNTTISPFNFSVASVTSMYLPTARSGFGTHGHNGNGNGNNGNGNGNNGNGNGNNGNGNGNTGIGNQGNGKPVGNAGGNSGGNGNGNSGGNGYQHCWAWKYAWGQDGNAPSGSTGAQGDDYRIVQIIADVSWITEGKLYTHQAEAVVELVDGNIQGVIGYWPLDEGSGSTVTDQSDVGNEDGTLKHMRSSAWVDGYDGTALNFDGLNDYVDLGKGVDDDISTAFTVASWVKPDRAFLFDWGLIACSSHQNGRKADWYLRNFVNDVSLPKWSWDRGFFWDPIARYTKYAFGIRTGNNSYSETIVKMDALANPSLDIYDWHYVAGTYNGDYSNSQAEITVQVVGKELKSSKLVSKMNSHGNDNIVAIGGIGPNRRRWFSCLINSLRCFDGTLDEVRLLNRSMPDDELASMAMTTASSSEGGDSSFKIVYWDD